MKQKQILISGGPVHAYLDDVKIITNKFRGGLMAQMAEQFLEEDDINVTYVCKKQSVEPSKIKGWNCTRNIIYHNGINDYMNIVLELAPDMDAVILGAAVANLVPKNKIEGKFPSHNYKEGDTIPIDFTIAPRIIDRVKKVAPKTQLFGFKLLAGVDYDELISAAYGVLLESKATAIIANDSMDLMNKYVVTKERGIHQMTNNNLVDWITERLNEEYYRTILLDTVFNIDKNISALKVLAENYKTLFSMVPEGFTFGSLAVKLDNGGFITTARGKNEIEDFVFVKNVDHEKRIVYVEGNKKASLNSPLLDRIFSNTEVRAIVHFHGVQTGIPMCSYATPGTTKDTNRDCALIEKSFVIENHGSYLLIDEEGNVL